MRNWLSGVLAGATGVAVLLFAVGPAQAVTFTLDEWNETNLDNSTANVTVDVTFDGTNTVLVVTYNAGNFPLTALGIDQFGYQADSDSTTGTTTGWSFTANGNMDGFGNFLRQDGKPSGDDLTFTVVVLGNQTGVLNSADDFAAHVRFDGIGELGCSGFVGGTNVSTTGDAGCGTSVPEPTTLVLLGSGLLGVGIASRRKLIRRRTSR